MLVTGKLYFDTAIPLSDRSFSWQWWIQMLYQSVTPVVSGVAYSAKEFVALSLIYHLGKLFQEQAAKILELCAEKDFDTEAEYRKLQNVIQELTDLDKYVTASPLYLL